MGYYLIENMMGFEIPVEEGSREYLKFKKGGYEKNPTMRKVGSDSTRFLLKAKYYIVPKDDWDTHNCPLIPVDLF